MDKLRLETADGVRSIQYIYVCWDSSGGGPSSRLEPLIIMALCLGYPQTGWRAYLTGMSLWHVVEEISIDTRGHARSSLHLYILLKFLYEEAIQVDIYTKMLGQLECRNGKIF
jgi:hypothetical protein